jgi:hypothetical protein
MLVVEFRDCLQCRRQYELCFSKRSTSMLRAHNNSSHDEPRKSFGLVLGSSAQHFRFSDLEQGLERCELFGRGQGEPDRINVRRRRIHVDDAFCPDELYRQGGKDP